MSSAHPSGKPNSRHTTRHPRRRSLDRRRHPPNCSTFRGDSHRHRSAHVPRGVDSAQSKKIRDHRARDRRKRGAKAPSRPTARSIGRSPPLVGSISLPAAPLGLRGSQTVIRWLHDLPCPPSNGGLAAPASANASRRRRHPEKDSRPREHAPPPTMADQPGTRREPPGSRGVPREPTGPRWQILTENGQDSEPQKGEAPETSLDERTKSPWTECPVTKGQRETILSGTRAGASERCLRGD
jgi:hypothetical protein